MSRVYEMHFYTLLELKRPIFSKCAVYLAGFLSFIRYSLILVHNLTPSFSNNLMVHQISFSFFKDEINREGMSIL